MRGTETRQVPASGWSFQPNLSNNEIKVIEEFDMFARFNASLDITFLLDIIAEVSPCF